MNYIKRIYNNVKGWLLQRISKSEGSYPTVHAKSLGREYKRDAGAIVATVSNEFNNQLSELQEVKRAYNEKIKSLQQQQSKAEPAHAVELQDEIQQVQEYLKHEITNCIKSLQEQEQAYINEHIATIEQLNKQVALFKQDYLNSLLKIRDIRNGADTTGRLLQEYAEDAGLSYISTLPRVDILTNQRELNVYQITTNEIQEYINNRTSQRMY